MDVVGGVVQSKASICRTRLASLVAATAMVIMGCGGRASRPQGDGGTSPIENGSETPTTAGTAAMTDPDMTAESTVSLIGSGSGAIDRNANTDMSLGPCFVGFSAMLDGTRVGIIAFVQAPGDYVGDSTHILFAQATTPEGRSYAASAGVEYVGDIKLHVSSVVPRFVGTAELLLVDKAQPETTPLPLTLAFDVPWDRPCGS